MRSATFWAVAMFLLLGLGFYSTGRSRSYRTEVFLDVTSGRFREDVYICWVLVRQDLSSSWVTVALVPSATEDWRFVSGRAFGREFPEDSRFASVQETLSRATVVFDTFEITGAERKRIATDLVRIWQQDGTHVRADMYLSSVLASYIERYDKAPNQLDLEGPSSNQVDGATP